jgi:hypothetical protein
MLLVKQFFGRLLARGYDSDFLLPLFNAAISLQHCKKPATTENLRSPLYLHVPFHPCDPISREIQQKFKQHLLSPLDEPSLLSLRNKDGMYFDADRLIVAYHRPRNLGNILAPRRLDPNGVTVSSFLTLDSVSS